MGLFKSYNDGRAIARGPKAIGRRAVYRGAISIYAAGGRKPKTEALTPGEQAAMAVLVLIALGLAILLVVWLV